MSVPPRAESLKPIARTQPGTQAPRRLAIGRRRTPLSHPPAPGEAAVALHVSRRARQRYRLEEALFTLEGDVVFADVAAARRLAERLAAARGDTAVTSGRLFALGLIHELLHATVARYRREVDPELFQAALGWLAARLGRERLEAALLGFTREFPPLPVWRGEVTPEAYLAGESAGRPNRERLLEEMLILWLVSSSPAAAPFRELFDDGELRRGTAYAEVVAALEEYLARRPAAGAAGAVGEPGESLLDRLQAPFTRSPQSLAEQLRFLYQGWAHDPGPHAARLLRAQDLLAEEERPVFPPGPGPVEVPELGGPGEEGAAAFSPDVDWMPNLVLVAKNLAVWLHQLSRDYGRPLGRLDEIPGEELDRLARWGINGLWLIGLWERSSASRRIKQLTGNPEAAGSAYSVHDYRIAPELGGEEALEELARRARRRGIRLAADMVPNHMGIDSRWVLEHPERFLSLPHPPFPSYRFTGPDLSSDPRVGIYLEDHYYDRSDAAVVFQRVDRETGEVRYVYHGNDGTSTPWNDTAQLDYLEPEVREAVTATILEVARRFPVIRFDAAMTLARRHVQRLWYPPPGEGGAIPSRAEHGLPAKAFDARMPEELWRQVVDRVAAEAPGTLLLAEAFWLMEAYFVRTLGMHRVYNSAFMVMLRDERNADYRQAIRNVLAFDPEILQRYVNFMNNPDERTAVDQFGKGDKYFGICTLMVTLPGLPMFGHGQVEGFSEKYGMEFLRPLWDERPDPWLVARHESRIFPLLHRRRLFAGSERFFLYDFETAPGQVDENVFAYSNRRTADGAGGERALVVYHNHPGSTRGRIRRSVMFAGGETAEGKRRLAWTTLDRGLGLEELDLPAPGEDPRLVRCRDQVTGLEHLWDLARIVREGLELELGPYACHVFLDFQGVAADPRGRWRALAESLAGRGVPSLDEALLEPALEPFLEPFRRLFAPELLERFTAAGTGSGGEAEDRVTAGGGLLDQVQAGLGSFLAALGGYLADHEEDRLASPEELAAVIRRDLEATLILVAAARRAPIPEGEEAGEVVRAVDRQDETPSEGRVKEAGEENGESTRAAEAPGPGPFLAAGLGDDPGVWATLYAWLLTRRLGELTAGDDPAERSRSWLDDLLLGKQISSAFTHLGVGGEAAREAVLFLKVLVANRLPPLAEGAPEAAAASAATGAEGPAAAREKETAGAEAIAGEAGAGEAGAGEAGAGLEGDPSAGPGEDPWRRWLDHPDVRLALRLHPFEGEVYFHRESFERLLFWGLFARALEEGLDAPATARAHRAALDLAEAAARAGYRVEPLLSPGP